MVGSHVRFGTTAPCLYPINPCNDCNSITIVVTIACLIHVSVFVLQVESAHVYFTQRMFFFKFKTTEKKIVGHHTRLRENDDLPL